MKIEASAPSNIALIKYMGKLPSSGNIPTNASLSYSVEHLRSFVVIERATDASATQDVWAPLEGFWPLHLSAFGIEKFLSHFERLKQRFEISGFYRIRSANNFPSDCGMASSASSFAALTLAASRLAVALHGEGAQLSLGELSRLSRAGSGSSCRSLFSPWALWRQEGAEPMDLDVRLEHAAVVLEDGKKPVTTSQAHLRVASSTLFVGRASRAEQRLSDLVSALRAGDWRAAYEISWAEFWDMHALFETSQPHFGYMNADSLRVLSFVRHIWDETGDGPIATMDAGANVHLFFRQEQVAAARVWLKDWRVIASWDSK